MITTTTSPGSPAPWRELFLEHVKTMKAPLFVLSTVRQVSSGPRRGGPTWAPRARTCVFRGLWAELEPNPKNEAPLNPPAYGSDLPTFTTDVRMDKLAELFGGDNDPELGEDPRADAWTHTGGGGPVEAVFWAPDPAVQWRISGRAYVLAPDVEGDAARKTRELILRRMRRKTKEKSGAQQADGDGDGDAWAFSTEITAHFGNLSPAMRGTFRNPPPGEPKALPVEDDRLGLGQKVTALDDPVARDNFRVVVIVPFEVDRTDLSNPDEGRRWRYEFASHRGGVAGRPGVTQPGGEIVGQWEQVEVWP